ncbi:Type-1 restriction enzyme EcoKI specificity protein [Rubripirellula amarantea]|uniref:Type-1 restriction enzyme EcoKI specificity protein n=1 Tax=Rubripirellula amarantea TaxID=2527999 RepID=A0A5C5WGK2_9BACT|nr:restriction endonuclease subunit S [Rubripirellula amarantea]TWT49239.1 Type-1 restriction enzyme EcoKI specificity protein [Rubripirellula amarantea]
MKSHYAPYPQYLASGVEWCDVLPASWRRVRLRWAAHIYAGGTPSKKVTEFWENGTIPWINSGAVNQGIVREHSALISKAAFANSSAKWIPNGGLVLALAGQGKTKGMVAQLGISTTCNQSMAAIVPTILLKPRYLFWWLTTNYQNIRNMAGGDLRDGLNLELLGNIECPIPTPDEQKQIARFLDYETAKIDALIEKQQQLIALLGEKRQAFISHAVTKGLNPDAPMRDSGVEWLGEVPEHWKIWKFGHFAPIITCGVASTPTYVDEDEGMPFLSAQNIRQNRLSLHKYNYIPHELHEQLTRHRRPLAGDILVTRVGAGIGDACVVDIDMEFSIYVSLTHIRVDPSIAVNRFIKYFFSSDYCKFLNFQGTVTGGGVGNLNVQNVKKYNIPLPRPEEQSHIADYLDHQREKFNGLILRSEDAIELLQERRTALISAAVTGKIDVRGWKRSSADRPLEAEMELA